ncbi:hypothetical protein SAMN04487944_10296 [Gracilibacillus ureilyticus]|uniref:Uncharacterized protein n=1 Tax=Gracilibacillus ureilyticus TaxID=531814 RepID=A0A1H9MQ63_9BACI|nr:hypothetical protein [Gracilibacillus ureilyticus]SER25627.1 hypothetical protein SAMN04487944_10296 [Gracilibacillus ureilyticus]
MDTFLAFLPLIFWLGLIGFGIWFAVNLIKTQREKNKKLEEISKGIQQQNKSDSNL